VDITPLDIQQREFKRVFRGVDPQEVSLFLQQVAELVSHLLKQLDSIKSELNTKNSTISDFRSREGLLKDTILAAQKTAEQMKLNAEKQARIILSEAEIKAENIITSAHKKLVGLQEEMEELARQKTLFKTKLKGMVESHLKLLELEVDEEEDPQGKLSLFSPIAKKP
jgi:cell division initiation protein